MKTNARYGVAERRHWLLLMAGMGLGLAPACSEDEGDEAADAADDEAEQEVVDDFPEAVPAKPADAREVMFPEVVIMPGQEVQNCYFLEPETEDTYAHALESYQGKFGHHLVLFYTIAPEAPGTVRDCTSIADMLTLIPAISSVNFGLEQFPDGMAVRIPAGTQLVVQQHYVNTSANPVRARDVLHLRSRPKAEIQELAGFWGISDIGFVLPPDPGREQIVEFDCVAPREMKVLMAGPHMHEWGKRFSASLLRGGVDGEPEVFMDVDPWKAEYRDYPPVVEFGKDEPLLVAEGDVIRTTCVFDNTGDKDLEFPSEMCASYGYYFPAPEGSETWTCSPTPE
jgi:hypothetical protein